MFGGKGLSLGMVSKLKVKARRIDHRVKVHLELDADGDGDIDLVDVYHSLETLSQPLAMNESGTELEKRKCADAMAASLRSLNEVPSFEKLSLSTRKRIAIGSKRVDYEEGEIIVFQGAAPEEMSVIIEGVASQHRQQKGADGRTENESMPDLGHGELVGAIGMLGSIPYTRTVKAETHCAVLRISRKTFFDVMLPVEEKWWHSTTELLFERLKTISLFSHLDAHTLHHVATEMGIMHFGEGRVMCAEGHHGDLMYVVLRGVVSLREDFGEEEEREVRTVGEGDFFEEMALVSSRWKHATTAVAKGAVVCAALSRDSSDQCAALQTYLYDHYEHLLPESTLGTPHSNGGSPSSSPRSQSIFTPRSSGTPTGFGSARPASRAVEAVDEHVEVDGVTQLMMDLAAAKVKYTMNSDGNDVAPSRYGAVARVITQHVETMLSHVDLHKLSSMMELQSDDEAEADLERIVVSAFELSSQERSASVFRPKLVAIALVMHNSEFERTFCAGWSLEARVALYSRCRLEVMEPGKVVYRQRQRDPARELFSIIKGYVHLTPSEPATSATASLRSIASRTYGGPGETLSPTSFAGNPVRLDTVVCTSNVHALAVATHDYHEVCTEFGYANEANRLEAAVTVFANGAGRRFTKNWPAWAIFAVASLSRSSRLPMGVAVAKQGQVSKMIYVLTEGRLRLISKIIPAGVRATEKNQGCTFKQATKTASPKKALKNGVHATEMIGEGCVGASGLVNATESATAFVISSEAQFLTLDESTFKFVKSALVPVLAADVKVRKQHMVELRDQASKHGRSRESGDGSLLPEIEAASPSASRSMSIEGRRLDRTATHVKEPSKKMSAQKVASPESTRRAPGGESCCRSHSAMHYSYRTCRVPAREHFFCSLLLSPLPPPLFSTTPVSRSSASPFARKKNPNSLTLPSLHGSTGVMRR